MISLSTDMNTIPVPSLPEQSEIAALPEPQRKAIAAVRERFPDLRSLQPMVGGDGAWIAQSPQAHLWFAIETDGYVHT